MKYRCIKKFFNLGLLTVGKVYDVEERMKYGITVYTVTNDLGKELKLGEKTLPIYFEKTED